MSVGNVAFRAIVKADLGNFRSGFDDRAVPVGIGDVIDAKRCLDWDVAERHDVPRTLRCSNVCGITNYVSFVGAYPNLASGFLGTEGLSSVT